MVDRSSGHEEYVPVYTKELTMEQLRAVVAFAEAQAGSSPLVFGYARGDVIRTDGSEEQEALARDFEQFDGTENNNKREVVKKGAVFDLDAFVEKYEK